MKWEWKYFFSPFCPLVHPTPDQIKQFISIETKNCFVKLLTFHFFMFSECNQLSCVNEDFLYIYISEQLKNDKIVHHDLHIIANGDMYCSHNKHIIFQKKYLFKICEMWNNNQISFRDWNHNSWFVLFFLNKKK